MPAAYSLLGNAQRAIYARLQSDTGAGGIRETGSPMLNGIYNGTPPEAVLPYATIDELTATRRRFIGASQGGLHNAVFVVVLHDDATSPLALYAAGERLISLFEGYALSVTSFLTVAVRLKSEQKSFEPKLSVQRIAYEFELVVNET